MKINLTHFVVFIFGIFLLFLFSACSANLKPFTRQLQDSYGWDERDLKKIQFYLSEDVVLEREAGSGRSRIEDGEIRIVDGKRVERVVIRKGTPGVYLFQPRENRFAISFEAGDSKFLIFGPERELNGKYTLRAREWKRDYGEITYGGKVYYTASENAYATLLVNVRKDRTVNVKSRTAGGRTIRN
jgi:hypothetical protein